MNQDVIAPVVPYSRKPETNQRQLVTLLFSSVLNYDALIEPLTLEENVAFLNQYFSAMGESIFTHQGTVDKYIGDRIMAVYGAPQPVEDHEWQAIQTAVAMRDQLIQFNRQRWQTEAIQLGIGLHADTVISGPIGTARQMDLTVTGVGVNLAAKLPELNQRYGSDILITETIYRPNTHRIWARELDRLRGRPKSQPIALYELIGLTSAPIPDIKQQILAAYTQGRQLYLNRQFPQAMAAFGKVLELDGRDRAASLHLDRCQHWLRHAPPEDWQGVEIL